MSTSATSATTSCTLPALAAMADWTQHNYAVDDLLCLPLPIKILVRRLGLIDESEGPVVLKDTAQCDQFYFTCNTTSAMVGAKVGRVVGEVQILKWDFENYCKEQIHNSGLTPGDRTLAPYFLILDEVARDVELLV